MAVAQIEDISRVLSPLDILEELQRRKKKYADRDEWYDRLHRYYHDHDDTEGIPVLAANAQSRPLLRPVGETIRTARTYSSQRLPPIVDDYSALMGRMPTSRVEPPSPDDEGEQQAELLTKFLYSTYELSRMDCQQALAGHYLSLLGDTVYILEPDGSNLRVVWNVTSPRICWPSFYHGYRRFDVYDILTAEVWTAEDLVRQLGVRPDNDQEENRTVVTYISPHQRTVVVGLQATETVAHVDWNLEFCPAVWVFNKVTGVMGMSDIASALGQQDFLNFCINVWADGIVHMTYPLIGVKNPQNMGADQIVLGPGAPPVALQGDGDIIVRNTQGDPRSLVEIIGHTLDDINSTTGTSQVRQQGQMKSSITTGRAVQQVQGPQSTRVDFKQQVLGDAIEAANRMTLAMQEKAPLLKRFKGPIFGSVKGVSFREDFDASKDIGGWHRNKVTWQQLVGMNPQQKAAVAYEGLVAQLWDDLEAREMAGVEDPLGMRHRIEAQKMWEAKLQSEMQKVMEPQQAPPGQPAQNQQGGFPGFGGVAPFRQQAQSIGAPGQPGEPTRGPGQQEDRTQPLKAALGRIATQLKGSVWLLTDGTVAVSDRGDYAKVLTALRQVMPGVKVKQRDEGSLDSSAIRLA